MRTLLFVFLLSLSLMSNAQNSSFEKKGFLFGVGVGASSINLTYHDASTQNQIALTMPNIKIGTMISSKAALILYLPGSVYSYKKAGRLRDRGFEAITPSVQYWFRDRFWVLGGAGLGMDAPAFYDIKNADERKFYFGGSLLASTGYEIWHKGKFALDLQARVHYGTAKLPDGVRTGTAFSFILGFNWY